MAQKKLSKNIERDIRYLLKDIRSDKISVESVFLFGSYAKGTQKEGSDIDICIISPNFTNSVDAMQYLLTRKSIIESTHDIEPIGMTQATLDDPFSSLSAEIRKYGIRMDV